MLSGSGNPSFPSLGKAPEMGDLSLKSPQDPKSHPPAVMGKCAGKGGLVLKHELSAYLHQVHCTHSQGRALPPG